MRDRTRRMSLALGVAAACAAPPAMGQQAQFIGLGNLGGAGFAQARALSADGSTVVGFTTVADGGIKAFRWTQATGMVSLGSLHGTNLNTDAFGVSADGSVVVGGGRLDPPGNEPFRWTETTGMVGLGHTGPLLGGQANAVSGDGSVVVGLVSGNNAFRWTAADGYELLGGHPGSNGSANARGISLDGSIIVGVGVNADSRSEGWKWDATNGLVGIGRLPGPPSNPDAGTSSAAAISADKSTIVGLGIGEFGQAEAFSWTQSGGIKGLGIPPALGLATEARAVSGDGSIIVGEITYDFNEELTNAIIDRGNGFELLLDVLVNDYQLDMGTWVLASAVGISEDGKVIAGWGFPSGDVFSLDWEPFIVRLFPACIPDLNGDGVIDADDFFLFLQLFADADPVADINNDGVIDADDFFEYLSLFAAGC